MGEQTSNRLRSGFVGFSFLGIGGNFVCADLRSGNWADLSDKGG